GFRQIAIDLADALAALLRDPLDLGAGGGFRAASDLATGFVAFFRMCDKTRRLLLVSPISLPLVLPRLRLPSPRRFFVGLACRLRAGCSLLGAKPDAVDRVAM